jgi:hypothetical protein
MDSLFYSSSLIFMKRTKFILCHKCQGTIVGTKHHPKLEQCGCMSSWVRGFEDKLTLKEAQAAQKLAKV